MKPIAQLRAEDWHRLNRLLQQALDLEVAERATWLDSLSADSSELRPLLERLLSSSSTAEGTFLCENLLPALPLAVEALDGMRVERAGDRIGPWRLEEVLGEGGMGTVWRAERADGILQRRAALKLPRAEWIDRGLAARMARERAILALLQHPHIAVLYDAGVTAEGRPYLALEYVEGQAITQFCETRRPGLESLLELYVQVIRAVAYAHAKLVIHRDLKPSNVLVTANGTPKLLDFGIAKLVDPADTSTAETALTRIGGRPLTLAYAAPEQVMGAAISVAADIYALGVMLYELLAGTRPYRSGADDARLLEHEILQGRIRPPSEAARDPDRARALRGDLDAIILKALKARPEDRYETAAAFADDIERKLGGRPVRAQPDSRAYRLRKFVVRNRVGVAAASAVLLAVGVGLGFALWQAGVARAQAALAREQAARANAMSTFVLSLIQQTDPRASQVMKAADLDMLRAIESRVEKQFKGDAGEQLQLRTAVARAYGQRGHHETARVLIRRALEEAQSSLSPDDARFLTARALGASFPIFDEASVKDIDRVVDRLRSAGPESTEALVDALLARVQSARHFGRRPGMTWDTLYSDSREAFDLAAQHLQPASGRQLHAAMSLSVHLLQEGGSRAEPDREREAIAVVESALAKAHADPNVIAGNVDLNLGEGAYGGLLCRIGRPYEGLRRLWDALAAIRTSHTDDAWTLQFTYSLIANCLNFIGDMDAIGYYAMAYDVAQRSNTTQFALALSASPVAWMMCEAERTEECIKFADRAALHVAQMPAGEHQLQRAAMVRPIRVRALIARGQAEQAEALALESLQTPTECCELLLRYLLIRAQRESGKLEDAWRSAEELLALMRRNGEAAESEAEILVSRASIEIELGRTSEALATIDFALPTIRKSFSTTDVVWGNAHLAYGRALLAGGRTHEAIDPLRMAYGFWLGHAPRSAWAAEAEYWLASTYLADGDIKRGRWMVAEARSALAQSAYKLHRALAARQVNAMHRVAR